MALSADFINLFDRIKRPELVSAAIGAGVAYLGFLLIQSSQGIKSDTADIVLFGLTEKLLLSLFGLLFLAIGAVICIAVSVRFFFDNKTSPLKHAYITISDSLREEISLHRNALRSAHDNKLQIHDFPDKSHGQIKKLEQILLDISSDNVEKVFAPADKFIILADAHIAHQLGCWSLGHLLYDVYLRFDPENAEAHFCKGVCLSNLNGNRHTNAAALSAYSSALAFAPSDIKQNRKARYLSYRGAMHKRLNHFQAAEVDLLAAKSMASDIFESNDIKYNLCCIYAMTHRKDELINLLDSWSSCAPEFSRIHQNMNRYFSNVMGDEAFQRALRSLGTRL